jgi:hypothetical protein
MGTISKNPAAISFQFETEAAGSSEISTYKTAWFYKTQDHNTNPSAFVNTAVWRHVLIKWRSILF